MESLNFLEHLIKYHIEETHKRFDDLKEDLRDIQLRIESLHEFKVQQIATSRTVSFIISGVCGLITLIVSTVISIKYH